MKIKRAVLFILAAIIICFLSVFYLKKEENTLKTDKKQDIKSLLLTKTVKNDIHKYELVNDGEICDFPESEITFKVDGKLVMGDSIMIPGMEFKKNQLLYRIDNEQAFNQLVTKKAELAKAFSFILPQLETKFPEHNGKWQTFIEGIKPTKLLPDYPSLFKPEERIFLIEKEFIQAYVKTKMLEKEMESYFFLAPFDGIFIESLIQSNELVTAGSIVAKIAEKTNLTAKIIVPKRDLNNYTQLKHIHFKSKKGKTIGKGRLLKSTKNTEKNRMIDVVYSVQANNNHNLIPGQNIKIVTQHYTSEKCIAVPSSLIKDNSVQIIINEISTKKAVKIIASTNKLSYISGLKDGDLLLLNN